MSIIIFDLGGVILDIDLGKAKQALSKYGGIDFEQRFSELVKTDFFDDYEIGKITSSEFRQTIRAKLQLSISDDEIDVCWNTILLSIPPHRIKTLRDLSKQHDLYLLSNTNEIHIDWVNDYIKKEFNISNLRDLFVKAYYSYEIGLRKPKNEIYQYVADDISCAPQECLFIDDSLANIEGAKQVGINAIHLPIGQEFLGILEREGALIYLS